MHTILAVSTTGARFVWLCQHYGLLFAVAILAREWRERL
jgi:hypothetical protein